MKNFKLSFWMTLGILFLFGCANPSVVANQPTVSPHVLAINTLRVALGLPDLPLEFRGMEHMVNSPSGDLPVAIYVDSLGRKFSVEPGTNQVVEMDARDLLASIPANAPVLSQDELKLKALKITYVMLPNFDSLLPNLMDNGGSKGDYYFFDWRAPASSTEIMPPFIQIGLHKSGFIFAYINTLLLE